MKTNHFNQPNNRATWLKIPINSGVLRHYLIDKSSLTRRLQSKSQHFSVQPVGLMQAKVLPDEATLLTLKPRQYALLRDVLLVCDGTPVVFAHSIFPKRSLCGAWRGLGRLGNKPLGATLFANPKVQRTQLSYKKLASQHRLYKRIMQLGGNAAILSDKTKHPVLWARRSVFSLNKISLGHAKILVTEVFLPAVLALAK